VGTGALSAFWKPLQIGLSGVSDCRRKRQSRWLFAIGALRVFSMTAATSMVGFGSYFVSVYAIPMLGQS
jgi:hypothetical protein